MTSMDAQPKDTSKKELPFPGDLRPLSSGDLPAVHLILLQWIRDNDSHRVIGMEVNAVIQAMKKSIEGKNDKHYIVANAESEAVGVMGIQELNPRLKEYAQTQRPCELINAFVENQKRGTGVGHSLFNGIVEMATELGYSELLWVSGSRYEKTAWKFYDNLPGVEAIATVIGFFAPDSPARIWRMKLPTKVTQ